MLPFYTTRSLLLLLLSFVFSSIYSQTVYVKHDATGANSGASWADAFTDLEDALSLSAASEIWVAAGTYKPGDSAPDTLSVFDIDHNVSLYGGFVGIETNLTERDPVANETILSGDIDGDDVQDEFSMNKSDNTRHVIYVDSMLTDVTIDGFSVIGGNTNDFGDSDFYLRAGGGIYALSPISVNQCIFSNNFGRSGGAIVLLQGASGSSVTNSDFSHNMTTERAAGIYIIALSDISLTACNFVDNSTVRGAVYPLRCANMNIADCLFERNINTGFAGAMFIWNSTGIEINNTVFRDNEGSSAGAIYYDGRELLNASNNISFDGCTFDGNKTATDGFGGGIDFFNASGIEITNTIFENNRGGNGAGFYTFGGDLDNDSDKLLVSGCTFNNNTSTDFGGGGIYNSNNSIRVESSTFDANLATNGGHIFNTGDGVVVRIDNCEFRNANSSGWGGAMTCYGAAADYQITECVFEDNKTANFGGAINCGFAAVVNIDDCDFDNNESVMSIGGAVALQNDSTELVVRNSIFENNKANSDGGAISANSFESSTAIEVYDCEFIANTSDEGFGGAIQISGNGGNDFSRLIISNSIFGFNISFDQGGAINNNNSNSTITSSLFYENISLGAGRGGAIATNASDSNSVEINILNTTFVQNVGDFSGGISQWTGDMDATLITTIKNCMFAQDGSPNYAIEAGIPELISTGGNLSDDANMETYLTHVDDINDESPEFMSPNDLDYRLTASSAGIDAGVEGAPEFDIDGNPRINRPDIGAYENQTVTNAGEVLLENNGMLRVAPNPIKENYTIATLNNDWTGQIEVRLTNLLGQQLKIIYLDKASNTFKFKFPFNGISAGVYYLAISNGEQVVADRLVKL